MATASTKFTYRCTSITESGSDTVNVSFVQVQDDTTADAPGFFGGGNFVLVLKAAEAAEYFPGQVYNLALTKKA